MSRTYKGELEVDSERGVIYFHLSTEDDVVRLNTVTLLRICRLPSPIPEQALDVTHMVGADWHPSY